MTQEEIAELTVNDYVGRGHSYYSTVYDAVMTALQLKDTQERDLFECSREANRKEEIKKEEVRNEEVVKQRDKKTSVC